MTVPAEHSDRFFLHFTHIDNLESILKNGLLSTNEKKKLGISHINIAEDSIQKRRSLMKVTCGPKGTIHDYVPFYLTALNPMFLALINSKNIDQQDIIFIAIDIKKISQDYVVFTDASANTEIPPNFYDDPKDLIKLNWELIDSKKWSTGSKDDLHKRMAEVLVYKSLPISDIDTIVVWNESSRDKVYKIYDSQGIPRPKVAYSPFKRRYTLHFTKFMIKGGADKSLITGPRILKETYLNGIQKIIEKRKQAKGHTFKFKNIKDCLNKIDSDFSCVDELKGIFELETDNAMHKENVSDHTLKVVSELVKLKFYKEQKSETQNILKLSAYLHDIGKGPKSKWEDGIQKAYPDHPVDSLNMVVRILTDDIEQITHEEIKLICFLVTYHDLLGEVMMKGRKFEQILSVVESEQNFDMLSAINEADVKAINIFWSWSYIEKIPLLKARFLEELNK